MQELASRAGVSRCIYIYMEFTVYLSRNPSEGRGAFAVGPSCLGIWALGLSRLRV